MKLIGYMPDVDPTMEGVITDCIAFVPNERGMQAAPSAQDPGYGALDGSSICLGAALVRKLDNTSRIFAGTSAKLMELASNVWNDVTRGTGAYTLGADSFWRFAQFGNVTLAAVKTETLQFTESGDFADVALAPKANIVETVGNFVFLFDTNDAGFGDSPNRWWCSAIRDYTDWVPSIETQCASNTLVSSPGRINAGRRFGDQIIAYKERAMYVGTYVGAPLIWDFQQIPGEAGCGSQEAVVNVGSADNPVHIFMGADDFWRFDGARPVPIGAPVRKTVYADLDAAYANTIKTLHDRINSRVYFFYPARGSEGTVNRCVVYNYRENRWGRDDRTIEAALEYISGAISWDTIPFGTWDTIPSNLSWDSPFWTSGNPVAGVFNSAHTLVSLDGIATNSSFTTGDMGDDDNFYLMTRAKPKWLTKPTSATLTNYYKANEGDNLTTGITTTMDRSRFDLLISSRWHRLMVNMVGDATLNEMDVDLQQDGTE
jgi:hypothetical protein